MFPFHTWLPDAHTEAPTAGSVILAGVLLKMGTYGFLRFSLPMFPDATVKYRGIMIVLSIIGIIYGALVCMMQKDMKKLIAYSSVSHMGFCTLGIFALTPLGLSGSIIQQINHGISTGALFLIVGVLYERRHTRLISEFGGLSTPMPNFAAVYLIMTLSSLGMPLLNGFIGEFTILRGVFEVRWQWAAWGVIGVILGAAYLLWLYQRVMFGSVTNPANEHLPDLNGREYATLIPLVVLAFWIGIYPAPLFRVLEQPVHRLVEAVHPGYYAAPEAPTPQVAPSTSSVNPQSFSPQFSRDCAGFGARRGPLMTWQWIFEQSRGDFFLILPEAMLVFFGLAILLTDFLLTKRQKSWNALTAMLGVVFSGGSLYMLRAYASAPIGPVVGFFNSIVIDPFFIFFGFLFLASTALVILFSVRYMEIEDEQHGEYYALMLFATVGMMFLACGNDLVVLFLALETMAMSFYVLRGFLRRDRRSNEAAMKYVLMGAFSSGILAYGFSILYGIAGSTNLRGHRCWRCGSATRNSGDGFADVPCAGHRCRRSFFQDCGGAVSSMGAGCV